MTDLLSLQDVQVWSPARPPCGPRRLLRDLHLDIRAGERVALVGPSGCGKSLTARTMLGLLPSGFRWQGSVSWENEALSDPGGEPWRRARGSGMALVQQEPLTSLNPVLTVGDQIAESLRHHAGDNDQLAWTNTLDLLRDLQVPAPEWTARAYPHQLSGGMRQRVLLAATMACRPRLLVADEPTSSLDVTVQREILGLIRRMCADRGMALLFITHDEALVPHMAERRVEMLEGTVVADEAVGRGVRSRHRAASNAWSLERAHDPGETGPVLSARNLRIHYGRQGKPAAVAGVQLDLFAGRALGLAGESGCGKTSLARGLSGHLDLAAGEVTLRGSLMAARGKRPSRQNRRRVQMLFQDPGGSLNPRQTIGQALHEAAGLPREASIRSLLEEVGLDAVVAHRFPHQLSGGQKQRVALARCLAAEPDVLIADEPTSALDRDSRDLILGLLRRVMEKRHLGLLLISHDLAVLRQACDRVAVMFGGLIMEEFPVGAGEGFHHPYTRQLVAALPPLPGDDPGLWLEQGTDAQGGLNNQGGGCPRFGLCPLQKPYCNKGLPDLIPVGPGRVLRCPEADLGLPAHFIDT